MSEEPKICVIIPVHNESKYIGSIVQALNKKNIPVLVIDDGSNDGSGHIAKNNGAQIIKHKEKKGKGFSLREGFEYIIQRGYSGVITMDGDGQHAVQDIDKFIVEARHNKRNLVIGNRMSNPQGMPAIRYLTNKLMSNIISWVCKQRIYDSQCGYRYLHCDVLQGISLSTNDFEIETEILIKSSKKGIQINSIPIETIYRSEESKINPFKDTIRFIAYFTKELFSSE